MNVTDRTITICTNVIGFVYHPPSDDHPYNGAPIGQLRKFICRNRGMSLKSLVEYLVENNEAKVFNKLLFLGLERSELLKQLIITTSIEKEKYEILKEANRIHLIGSNEIKERLPSNVRSLLRTTNSLPHSYMSIVLALKCESMWDMNVSTSLNEVTRVIEQLKSKWVAMNDEDLRELGLVASAIAYYDDLDAFKLFYTLIPDKKKLCMDFAWDCEKYHADKIAKWLFLNKREYIHHPYQHTYRNVEEIVANKNWLALANAPDYYVRKSVSNNNDSIWIEYAATFTSPPTAVCDFVNLSHMIVFGARFSDRHDEIERIKQLLG